MDRLGVGQAEQDLGSRAWVFPTKPGFDADAAFRELPVVYWEERTSWPSLQVGATAYIYRSKPEQWITHRCRVEAKAVPPSQWEVDHSPYYTEPAGAEGSRPGTRLRLEHTFSSEARERLTMAYLSDHGVKPPLRQRRTISEETLAYLELVEHDDAHSGEDVVTDAGGQGWLADPVLRKQVEDIAQARLMDHYEVLGWAVEDVRHKHRGYDALATKEGHADLYLEAKGTTSAGGSILVTAHELEVARRHPEQYVLGVLAAIRPVDSAVGPDSGELQIYAPWNPDDGTIKPVTYRWKPGTRGSSLAFLKNEIVAME